MYLFNDLCCVHNFILTFILCVFFRELLSYGRLLHLSLTIACFFKESWSFYMYTHRSTRRTIHFFCFPRRIYDTKGNVKCRHNMFLHFLALERNKMSSCPHFLSDQRRSQVWGNSSISDFQKGKKGEKGWWGRGKDERKK